MTCRPIHALGFVASVAGCNASEPNACDQQIVAVRAPLRPDPPSVARPLAAGDAGPTLHLALPDYTARELADRTQAIACALRNGDVRGRGDPLAFAEEALADESGYFYGRPWPSAGLDVTVMQGRLFSTRISDRSLEPTPYSELDPETFDDGVGLEQARLVADEAYERIVDLGVLDSRSFNADPGRQSQVLSGSSFGPTSVSQFSFGYFYEPGGVFAFGTALWIDISRRGEVMTIELADLDITAAGTETLAIDETEASTRFAELAVQGFDNAEAFVDSERPGYILDADQSESDQEIRWVATYSLQIPRGSPRSTIAALSMVWPDQGLEPL